MQNWPGSWDLAMFQVSASGSEWQEMSGNERELKINRSPAPSDFLGMALWAPPICPKISHPGEGGRATMAMAPPSGSWRPLPMTQ